MDKADEKHTHTNATNLLAPGLVERGMPCKRHPETRIKLFCIVSAAAMTDRRRGKVDKYLSCVGAEEKVDE